MSTRRTGIDRERKLRQRLELEGWWTCRAAGSFGDADVIALKWDELPRLIEIKSTERGPFHSFGPADRDALISAAARAGAIPWLVWWPVRRQPQWLPVSEWPVVRLDTCDSAAIIQSMTSTSEERA